MTFGSILRRSLPSNPLSYGFITSIALVAGYMLWKCLLCLQHPLVYFLQIVLGIMVFFAIPGFCIVKMFYNSLSTEKLGLILLFGLAVQILNVQVLQNVAFLLHYAFDLSLSLLILTLLWIFFISIFGRFVIKDRASENKKDPPKSRQLTKVLYPILIVGLSLRIYYAIYNTSSITPDGALYCDMARSLVTTGNFTSLIINDGLSAYPYYNTVGLNVHPSAWFTTAFFFMFGNVSLFTANLTTVFSGSLLILVAFMLTREIFDVKVALVCATLVAFHPLFAYFSVILYGPEILSALFTTAALYFLFLGTTKYKQERRHAVATGLFLSLAETSWFINFYCVVPVVFILHTFRIAKFKTELEETLHGSKRKVFSFLLAFLLLALIVIARKMDSLPIVWYTLAAVDLSLISLILLKRRFFKPLVNLCYTILPVIIIFHISLIPVYSVPMAQIHPVIESIKNMQPHEPFLLTLFPQKEINLVYLQRSMESMYVSLSPLVTIVPILTFITIPLTLFAGKKKKLSRKACVLIENFKHKNTRLRTRANVVQTRSSNYNRIWVLFLASFFPVFITTIYLPRSTIMWADVMVPRLLLFPALVLLISFGVALYYIIFDSKAMLRRFISRKFSFLSYLRKMLPKHISKIFLGLTMFLILGVFLFPMYNMNFVEIDSFSTERYGWKSHIEWINENTAPSTVLGAALPRNWAWFSNRTTVGIYNFSIPPADINSSDLVRILRTYGVEYLIVDDWFWYIYPNLRNLYNTSRPIGSVIQLDTGNNQSSQAFSLRLVSKTNRTIHNVLIYQLMAITRIS